jgi:hypothetical protein
MRIVTRSRPVSRGPWLAGAVAFVVIGFAAIMQKVPLAGWPALLAGGVLLFFATRPEGGPDERIVLDDAGVTDVTFSVGPIPWDQIIRAELKPLVRMQVISLEVTDPERWIKQQPEHLGRFSAMARELGVSPVMLAISGIDMDPAELVQLINDRARGVAR